MHWCTLLCPGLQAPALTSYTLTFLQQPEGACEHLSQNTALLCSEPSIAPTFLGVKAQALPMAHKALYNLRFPLPGMSFPQVSKGSYLTTVSGLNLKAMSPEATFPDHPVEDGALFFFMTHLSIDISDYIIHLFIVSSPLPTPNTTTGGCQLQVGRDASLPCLCLCSQS